jgi:predicted transcriptional regulator
MYDLPQIKAIRKKCNISQVELAKLADVSQSLIAKIEAGKIDPTYTKSQKIFAALDKLNQQQGEKAKNLMNTHVFLCKSTDTIKQVALKMRKHNISQMPVMLNDNVAGIISEKIVMNTLINKPSFTQVGEVMQTSPPIVAQDTTQEAILSMLNHFQAVLVAHKGKVQGVITKSDMLDVMLK